MLTLAFNILGALALVFALSAHASPDCARHIDQVDNAGARLPASYALAYQQRASGIRAAEDIVQALSGRAPDPCDTRDKLAEAYRDTVAQMQRDYDRRGIVCERFGNQITCRRG